MKKSVNIHIADRNDFPCPVGWTVDDARNEIRSGYGLVNGYIQRNGIAMRSSDIITSNDDNDDDIDIDYRFVNFREQERREEGPKKSVKKARVERGEGHSSSVDEAHPVDVAEEEEEEEEISFRVPSFVPIIHFDSLRYFKVVLKREEIPLITLNDFRKVAVFNAFVDGIVDKTEDYVLFTMSNTSQSIDEDIKNNIIDSDEKLRHYLNKFFDNFVKTDRLYLLHVSSLPRPFR